MVDTAEDINTFLDIELAKRAGTYISPEEREYRFEQEMTYRAKAMKAKLDGEDPYWIDKYKSIAGSYVDTYKENKIKTYEGLMIQWRALNNTDGLTTEQFNSAAKIQAKLELFREAYSHDKKIGRL